jgi:hypothetical protein
MISANTGVNKQRQSEILKILGFHGPLTTEAISLLTSPRQSLHGVRRTLAILGRENLIDRCVEGLNKNFYQLNPSPDALNEVARVLKISPDKVQQNYKRKRNLSHNELVELVLVELKTILPDFCFTPDWEMTWTGKAEKSRDQFPDLLVESSSQPGSQKIKVAFEIEKTQKSNPRLTRKFKRMTGETRIDGLVYFCETDTIRRAVIRAYKEVLNGSRVRISQYQKNFLLFGIVDKSDLCATQSLTNYDDESVDFGMWISALRETKWTLRRDANISEAVGAVTAFKKSDPPVDQRDNL